MKILYTKRDFVELDNKLKQFKDNFDTIDLDFIDMEQKIHIIENGNNKDF